MAISVPIELDDEEEAAFAVFFHECLVASPNLTPKGLAKSILLGCVMDDLETHRAESRLN